MARAAWWIVIASCVATALYVEWHTDEVTVVLAMMMIFAVTLGAAKPGRSLAAGAILGFSILAAHAATEALGMMRPGYLHQPISVGDWMAMAVLGLLITGLTWSAGALRSKIAGPPAHV